MPEAAPLSVIAGVTFWNVYVRFFHGAIKAPQRVEYGYDRRIASGVIAASGTLAQIIPPSLVLIVVSMCVGVGIAFLLAVIKPEDIKIEFEADSYGKKDEDPMEAMRRALEKDKKQ